MSARVYRSRSGSVSFRYHSGHLLVAPVLALFLMGVGFLNLFSGSFDLNAEQVMAALFTPDDSMAEKVIWDLRLPRYVAALLAGAMLGLSGAILQMVTRNPLADPSLVGISQGAALCVVSLIVMWPAAPLGLHSLAGFLGAILAAALVQWIAIGKRSAASLRFILVGIGVSAMISAGTNAMLTYGQINQAAAALAWLAGGVHTATWHACAVLSGGLLLFLPALVWFLRPLSGLRFGPEIATGMGINIRRERTLVITLSVALAALAVSMIGPLGFVGLIAAHIASRIAPGGIAGHLLLTALVGACLVALADWIGRTIAAPVQVPAGIVTALLGAPMFVLLLFSRAARKYY